MMRPESMIGRIARVRLFDRPWKRAAIFGGLIALFLLLTFVPERHQASMSLTPTDPDSLGLGGTLGQLGAVNNVFGNQAAVEVAMRVGKSIYVRETAIKQLDLAKRLDQPNRLALHRWLANNVTVRSLRGGIITIEMTNRDPVLARDIVGGFAKAMQERLAEINRRRITYKRDVLRSLVSEASDDYSLAQAAYDQFRLKNRYADPRQSMAAVADQIPMLDGKIKALQIQLSTARRVFTEENITVKQMRAELAALQAQLVQVRASNPQRADTVGRIVNQSGQLFKLERELAVTKSLYDNYMRYLQGTAVEEMTSAANIRVLEEPFVATARQLYLPALAAALAFFLLWMAIEFYRLRPPLGAQLEPQRETDA